jgi:Spy/CpxP family protein refolding chaperone
VTARWFLAAMLVPGVLCAQAAAPVRQQGPAWWESQWWNGPLVQNLDLSETQRRDIRNTVREYRGHLLDLREAAQRTDEDLDALLNASPLDRRKATEAIDRLANARAELTRTLSQMTLRLRTILSDEQWQHLQQRAQERKAAQAGQKAAQPPDAYKQR